MDYLVALRTPHRVHAAFDAIDYADTLKTREHNENQAKQMNAFSEPQGLRRAR